jgi:hypothetical protein
VSRKKAPVIVMALGTLTKLHYTGLQTLNWYDGEVTGTRYEFGLLKMIGYVDDRDVEAFLAYQEDSKKVFEKA